MAIAAVVDSTAAFYGQLDSERRIFIKQKTGEIKSLLRVCWSEVAHRAIEVKAELDHGQFLAWIELELTPEFGVSERSLQMMMRAFKAFEGKSENFSDLPIAKSAAYELADAPESARDEAIDRAKSGESITKSIAKEIATRHQPGESIEHQGQRLEVVSSDDIVVQARSSGGKVIPILAYELLPADLPVMAVPTSVAPAKPAPIESISLRLESAEARMLLLEHWMRRAIAYVPASLQAEARNLGL